MKPLLPFNPLKNQQLFFAHKHDLTKVRFFSRLVCRHGDLYVLKSSNSTSTMKFNPVTGNVRSFGVDYELVWVVPDDTYKWDDYDYAIFDVQEKLIRQVAEGRSKNANANEPEWSQQTLRPAS